MQKFIFAAKQGQYETPRACTKHAVWRPACSAKPRLQPATSHSAPPTSSHKNTHAVNTHACIHDATHADEWPVMLFGDQWIIYTHMPLIIQGPSLNKLQQRSPKPTEFTQPERRTQPVHPLCNMPLEYDGDIFARRQISSVIQSFAKRDVSQCISVTANGSTVISLYGEIS